MNPINQFLVQVNTFIITNLESTLLLGYIQKWSVEYAKTAN